MEQDAAPSIEQAQGDDVIGKLDAIAKAVGQVVETIRPPEKSMMPLSAARQATHVRLRGYELVAFCRAESATIVLHVGNMSWEFTPQFITPAAGNLPYYSIVVPFPILIDRGIDVYWTGTFDAILSWLTYLPE